jgi:erythrocyte band 7 integral membrane protein
MPSHHRLGRLTPGGSKGPGIFFVLPCIEKYCCSAQAQCCTATPPRYYKVDLRTITLGVPPQEVSGSRSTQHGLLGGMASQVLTRDSVTVSVDAVVYYR